MIVTSNRTRNMNILVSDSLIDIKVFVKPRQVFTIKRSRTGAEMEWTSKYLTLTRNGSERFPGHLRHQRMLTMSLYMYLPEIGLLSCETDQTYLPRIKSIKVHFKKSNRVKRKFIGIFCSTITVTIGVLPEPTNWMPGNLSSMRSSKTVYVPITVNYIRDFIA